MLNPLSFPKINPYTNCLMYITNSPCGCKIPSVIDNILNCRISENPIITPSNRTTVVTPSAANRTLGSVTVMAQTPLYFSMNIVGTGNDSITVKNAATAVSSDTAVATVAVSGNAVVVTGVAAGTSVVSVFNATKELIATIYVTVVEA